MNEPRATIIGAGLAGSEAAWQLLRKGIAVEMIEMKPEHQTPAHHSDQFAELVCSNSFRGNRLSSAVGLLKEEMRCQKRRSPSDSGRTGDYFHRTADISFHG